MTTNTTTPTVHSVPSTLLGAGVGAAIGFVALTEKHPTAWVLGGAIAGGLIGWLGSSKPNPAYIAAVFPPSPAPPLQQVSGGGVLTVSPTLQTQTVSLDVQDPVLIYLPAGATWSSMDGAPVADKTSPIAFTFLGPINHTIVWFDSLNQQHESTYFFVLNPSPTPTTNA